MAKKVTRKHWVSGELEFIWNLSEHSEKRLSQKNIARITNKKFNKNRTEISVRSAIARIRDGEYIKKGLVKFNTQERTDIFERMGYDSARGRYLPSPGEEATTKESARNARFVEDLPQWQQDALRMADMGIPYRDIVQELSGKYNINRTLNQISAMVSVKRKRIKQGKLGHRSIEERADEGAGKGVAGGDVQDGILEGWQQYLVNARRSGASYEDIRKTISERYGVDKNENSLRAHIAAISRKGNLNQEERSAEKGTDLAAIIRGFDEEYIAVHVSEREKLVYDFMANQARALRQMDVVTGYKGMSFDQIMGLSEEERMKIAKVLQGPKPESGKISQIDIVAIPGFGHSSDQTGIVIPVFHNDIQTSGRGLSSMLYDVSIAAAHQKQFGMKPAKDFQDRFLDLARLNVISGSNANYALMAEFIAEKVSKGSGSDIKVHIYEDLPLYNFRLRRE